MYEKMKDVIEHIVAHKLEGRSLEDIAASMHMSPGHLQKLFTKWVGITPKQFSRYLSVSYAKELLAEKKSTMNTAYKAGLSGTGRLHDLFVDIEAMTPGEYKEGKITISYRTFTTQFGICLAASTERGVCNILFADTKEEVLKDLKERWPKAKLMQKKDVRHEAVQNYFSGITPASKIKLHVHGTNFQVKVWEALLTIPEGGATTYGIIAKKLNCNGSQAVGGAVGNNPVGCLIPCHRVLKSTGEISGYRWGVSRKRAMLLSEASRTRKE